MQSIYGGMREVKGSWDGRAFPPFGGRGNEVATIRQKEEATHEGMRVLSGVRGPGTGGRGRRKPGVEDAMIR